MREQLMIQKQLVLDELGKRTALELVKSHKTLYDSALDRADYRQFHYLAFSLRDVPDIACTGALIPAGDFAGTPRQGLAELVDLIPPVFTIVPATAGGIALLGWLGDSAGNLRLAQSLEALLDADVPAALVRYAFSYCENLFMSPGWWNGLATHQEALIQRMNAKATPDTLRDDGMRVVAWQLVARHREM